MKNLFGAVASTHRIFSSIKMLMLVLFMTIGFTSCDDQSNSDILPKSEFNLKSDFDESFSRCTCGLSTDGEIGGCKGIKGECATLSRDSIGGGKSSSGTLQRISTQTNEIGGSKDNVIIKWESHRDSSDIGGGGKATSTTLKGDIGGRNGTGTSSGGEFQISDIGGRTTNTSDVHSDLDIGGRKGIDTGNLTFADIGGSRDLVIIRRIPVPFTSEIEGISTSIGQ